MRGIILISIIINALSVLAIKYPNEKPEPKIFNAKDLKGVKPINGQFLFIAETEVSNQAYRNYLHWLKKNKPLEYKSNFPDTAKWGELSTYCAPFISYYFQHPAYSNYPMVNITQRQAHNYCAWLHDSLQKQLALAHSNIDQFVVRLPTEKEWMLAARGGLPESSIYPWEGQTPRITKGKNKDLYKWQLNCKASNNYGGIDLSQWSFITTEIYSYWPNGFGLYNMSGNVAEWIAEHGKSKGGSWSLPPYNARIDMAGFHDGDTNAFADIGFRYIIEIISFKDSFIPVQFSPAYFKKLLMQVPKMDSNSTKPQFSGKTEVSNAEYRTFLLENPLPQYQISHNHWSEFFNYKYFEMYGQHSGFNDFPVVNISFQAAQAYCDWLSRKYNGHENRKYKKVVFRLPSEKEWEWMAQGGDKAYYYPWGGPYCRNSRGCYLANFCPLEEQYFYKTGFDYGYNYPNKDTTISRGVDGAILPVHTTSYFPNLLGIYNCAGNVSEMIAKNGISKGGSWNSNNHKIAIKSRETYEHPNPNTGFRIWMEILEE